MPLSYEKADLSVDLGDFLAMDTAIFGTQDSLPPNYLQQENVEAHWILLDGVRIGAILVELDTDVAATMECDSPPAPGVVQSTSIGLLPDFRGKGYGPEAKIWTATAAPFCKGRTKVVSCARRGNDASHKMARRANFKAVAVREGYYADRDTFEDGIVYERVIR